MPIQKRTRKTRQRHLVYETLKASTEHPTAEMLFLEVRKSLPKISLGTVYRNLGVLKEQGLIFEIPGPNHTMHYDANLEPHAHFICEECGTIVDIWDCRKPSCRGKERLQGFVIQQWNVEFRGLCQDCNRNRARSSLN